MDSPQLIIPQPNIPMCDTQSLSYIIGTIIVNLPSISIFMFLIGLGIVIFLPFNSESKKRIIPVYLLISLCIEILLFAWLLFISHSNIINIVSPILHGKFWMWPDCI